MSAFSRPGAYGFQVAGVAGDASLLDPVPDEWPLVQVGVGPVLTDPPALGIGDSQAVTRLIGGGHLVADRQAQRADFYRASGVSADALVHPYLAPVAALFAMWNGWVPVHAGAFVAADRTWLVIGIREAGKSMLMADLAARGVPVVADDLVVVAGSRVFAGPRTLDLRGDVADRYEGARRIEDAGQRTRWRLMLPSIAPELPEVGGSLILRWGSSLEVEPLVAAARVELLSGALTVSKSINVPGLLAIAARPAWRVSRPQEWSAAPAALDAVLDTVR